MHRQVDVAIVGAGTAGLAALREVRARTDNFVLINSGPYGTSCARVGCMPSKALIAAASAFHDLTKLHEFGVRGGGEPVADIPAVLRRVRVLRDGTQVRAWRQTATSLSLNVDSLRSPGDGSRQVNRRPPGTQKDERPAGIIPGPTPLPEGERS